MWKFISIAFALFAFAAAENSGGKAFVRQMRSLSSPVFDEIFVEGGFIVSLVQVSPTVSNGSQGAASTVEIESTMVAHPHIVAEIRDNHILSITVRDHLELDHDPRIFIRFVGPLRRYKVLGGGRTFTNNSAIVNMNNEQFILDKQGGLDINLDLKVPNFAAQLSGSGSIQLKGEVREVAVWNIQGSVRVDAMALIAKRTKLDIAGSADVKLMATDDIEIFASGRATVSYKLAPGKQPSRAMATGKASINRLN